MFGRAPRQIRLEDGSNQGIAAESPIGSHALQPICRDVFGASGAPYEVNPHGTQSREALDERFHNQWGRKRLPALNDLIKKYPEAKVSYTPSMSESEESLE